MLTIDGTTRFDPETLTHSAIIDGQFGEERFERIFWNDLLVRVVAKGFAKLIARYGDREKAVATLAEYTGCKLRGSPATNYKAIPNTGLWVGGQDAADVWIAARSMSNLLDVEFELTVWWPAKPGAAHPNTRGRVTYVPVCRELLA